MRGRWRGGSEAPALFREATRSRPCVAASGGSWCGSRPAVAEWTRTRLDAEPSVRRPPRAATMSLLQSALDFLAGPGSLGGAAGRDQTDFVGQTVEMGELRLRVRRVLAEGEAGAGGMGPAGGGSGPGENGRGGEGHGRPGGHC